MNSDVLDRLIDSGPRYGIGWDAESSEFLIEDRNRHVLIARSGTDAVRELVEQANLAPDLARRLKLAMRFVPHPETMSGYGDTEAPDDEKELIAIAGELHNFLEDA